MVDHGVQMMHGATGDVEPLGHMFRCSHMGAMTSKRKSKQYLIMSTCIYLDMSLRLPFGGHGTTSKIMVLAYMHTYAND